MLGDNRQRQHPPRVSAHQPYGSLWQPSASELILILAPHPDDEVVATGGVIAFAAAQFAASRIRVALATNGDASYLGALSIGRHSLGKHAFHDLALKRQRESLRALHYLGLARSHVRFWGFPDRGLAHIWESHWDPRHAYRSPTTGFSRSEQRLNSPRLPYTGMSLLALLQRELIEFKPTTIILPHPHDGHPDHRALARFTMLSLYIMQSAGYSLVPHLLTYVVRPRAPRSFMNDGAGAGGVSALARQSALDNTPSYLPLPVSLRAKKVRALQCFRSQRLAAFQPLRRARSRAFEVFIPLRPYAFPGIGR